MRKHIFIFTTILTLFNILNTFNLSGRNKQDVLDILTSTTESDSDKVSIESIIIEQVGTDIFIKYHLYFGKEVRSCRTTLKISDDGGRTFRFKPSASSISGDNGIIRTDGIKLIKYDCSKDKSFLMGKQLRFKVEIENVVTSKIKYLISGQSAVYPQMSYGLMFGVFKQYGGYIKARSDFRFPEYFAENKKQSYAIIDEYFSRTTVTVGALMEVTKWFSPYIGVGYGNLRSVFVDDEGDSIEDKASYLQGVSLEGGFIFKFRKIALVIGANNTKFIHTDFEVGIGYIF